MKIQKPILAIAATLTVLSPMTMASSVNRVYEIVEKKKTTRFDRTFGAKEIRDESRSATRIGYEKFVRLNDP